MKNKLIAFVFCWFAVFFITSCDSKKSESSDDVSLEEMMDELEEMIDEEEFDEKDDEDYEDDEDAREKFSYEAYNYTETFTEEKLAKGPSDFFDRRDRDNDEFISIQFSDGYSGTLVLREGDYFSYSIREKTEILFASKEDGLQSIWDNSRLLQDAGAAIAKGLLRTSGPKKKDGTPDMRFNENK